MGFTRTTAINKLLAMEARKRVVQGGTWAGKTYGIAACVINYAAKYPNKKCTIVAETIPAVKEGALEDFLNIMQDTGRFIADRFNRNSLSYTFANGSKVQFKSFENEGKAKAAGKRDLLFINECNHIPFKIADALMTRTNDVIWLDFNPDNEFWAHTEILPMPDSEFLLLKYSDNEALPATILTDLMQKVEKAKTSTYWANWCKVYIDGEIGNLQGVVYPNWAQIDTLPEDARLERIGLDFGFSNDPTAAVGIYRYDGGWIWDEIIYQTGLVNSEVAALLKDYKRVRVVCDSAEPKSIVELKRAGVNAHGALKGRDSVLHGIQLINSEKISVTSRSTNIIRELRKYCWKEDRGGEITNTPIDAFNHAMDGVRYAMQDIIHKPNTGKYVVG